jgi:hypothetical protein
MAMSPLTLSRHVYHLFATALPCLVALWRVRKLNPFFNAALQYAPAPLREWIEARRAEVRASDLRRRIDNRSRLVPEPELRALLARGLRLLEQRHGAGALGCYLEFGVYNGTSLLCMYRETEALGLRHMRLFGFDSFQGLPPSAQFEDEGRWEAGRCYAPLEFTTAVLEAEGVDSNRVTLVPGWFSDTLTPHTCEAHGIRKASVIMIDCDLYSSAKQALDFCAGLIEDEALVIFDEFNPRGLEGKHAGERRAFAEFLDNYRVFDAQPFGKYKPRSQAFLVTRTGVRADRPLTRSLSGRASA